MIRLLASLWPYRIVRWLLACVFLYAGLVKLPHLQIFVETIVDFGLVAEEAVFVIALGIIGIEIVAGIGLLLDVRGALGTITCLLVMFVGVLSYGVAINLDIDCGCFGPGRRNAGLYQSLIMDGCLLAACGYLYASRWVRSSGPTSLRSLWRQGWGKSGESQA